MYQSDCETDLFFSYRCFEDILQSVMHTATKIKKSSANLKLLVWIQDKNFILIFLSYRMYLCNLSDVTEHFT